jgi:hypothetical protein
MTLQHRSRWIGLLAAVVVGVAAIVGIVVFTRHIEEQPSDCQVVRELIAYNATYAATQNKDQSTDLNKMQDWADQLHEFSTRIHDGDLSKLATHAADLAHQAVQVVRQGRAEEAAATDPTAPVTWPVEYGKLDHQMRNDVAALDKACPA